MNNVNENQIFLDLMIKMKMNVHQVLMENYLYIDLLMYYMHVFLVHLDHLLKKKKVRNFNRDYKILRECSSSSRVNREDVSLDFFIVNFDKKRESDGERLLESKT